MLCRVTIDSNWVKMGGPAPAVSAPDATCTLLPLTSFPKNKIKVLLLENISNTAVEMFESERFQIVSSPTNATDYQPEACQPACSLYAGPSVANLQEANREMAWSTHVRPCQSGSEPRITTQEQCLDDWGQGSGIHSTGPSGQA